MNRLRDPQWALIFLFLGLIAAVPLAQTAIELTQGDEGVVALEIFGAWPTAQHLRSSEKKMETASFAGRAIRPWLQAALFKTLGEGGEKVVVGKDGWYFFKPGLKYMLARHHPGPHSHGTNDPVPAVVDFRDQLAARGIRLLVMPVPNKESIYPDQLTDSAKEMKSAMAPRTRETLERLRNAQIEVVDLFEEFSEARRQRGDTAEALYLKQDTHWSPAGVAIAARAVSRRLTELGWLQPGSTEYREQPAPVERLGDILRMLQAPKIEASVAPEKVAAVKILRADGQPYADEASAEVLVIGDSFMRIYQTDAPNAAGFISHLARELKQPMMSLVNDGGGATLVREELASRPIFLDQKKVVVWEFVERDIGLAVKGWARARLNPAPKTGSEPARN